MFENILFYVQMLHPPQQMRSGRELLFFGDVYCFTAARAEK
jgi:hypothetical protein